MAKTETTSYEVTCDVPNCERKFRVSSVEEIKSYYSPTGEKRDDVCPKCAKKYESLKNQEKQRDYTPRVAQQPNSLARRGITPIQRGKNHSFSSVAG